jgi:hypothetical protein
MDSIVRLQGKIAKLPEGPERNSLEKELEAIRGRLPIGLRGRVGQA